MTPYLNLVGYSGVSAYDVQDDGIVIQYSNGAEYLYSYEKPGKDDVEEMIRLAEIGEGLNRFVNRRVKQNYEKRLK
ncbi:hypothetical protein OXI21_02625 [Ignatzschineria sp. RMDPL8A]|uniref:hypothetical protein n=1 Tax=Ignatzschineria sp. RMDPL8A TaxID=2999236 RepID=UPI0016B03C5E|nr:hypothetical protein [Ignatzschineria sp. RMDPL8A]MDG9729312.1 hypothetical protein [Ignatzschineria sp. RMDPL8A]NLD09293.1 hypothetical protein [Xanthomonadaceae bacterium]